MAELHVGVSGLGPLQPGRAVMRALREGAGERLRFVGLSYDPLEPTNYEADLVERSYFLPYPFEGSPQFLERLLDVKKTGGLDVIVPTLDLELPLLMKLEAELLENGIRVAIPRSDAFAERSKARLPELAKRLGFQTPPTQVLSSYDAVWAAASRVTYPFIVKGPFHQAYMVQNVAQLDSMVTKIVQEWGFPVIFQQVISGTEYDIVALGDGEGGLLGAVPMRKLLLDDKGKAWGSVTIREPALEDLADRVVSGLRWRGILELEVIHEPATGALHVIEVNPRTPAWIYLSVAAGQNLPLAALQLALGESVEPLPPYRTGVMQVRQCVDVVCPLQDYEALVMKGEVNHRGSGSPRSRPE